MKIFFKQKLIKKKRKTITFSVDTSSDGHQYLHFKTQNSLENHQNPICGMVLEGYIFMQPNPWADPTESENEHDRRLPKTTFHILSV